ncbi:hypothetical protein DFH07DRAFT_953227 [Mycena maculata]|uniref:Uncharacterized protein n=1 Tax=Mycena maculata TaxID=230809 RepID=A0AAD7JU54_9AGAR|nr:hypothetical protein DFH07DRAFT_953227 [Mycena maculata]
MASNSEEESDSEDEDGEGKVEGGGGRRGQGQGASKRQRTALSAGVEKISQNKDLKRTRNKTKPNLKTPPLSYLCALALLSLSILAVVGCTDAVSVAGGEAQGRGRAGARAWRAATGVERGVVVGPADAQAVGGEHEGRMSSGTRSTWPW